MMVARLAGWPTGMFTICNASWLPRSRSSSKFAPNCGRAGKARTGCGSSFRKFRGLGHSPTALHFAIASLQEARAYLQHPALGPRLCKCTALVNDIDNSAAERIFGYPDHLKFRSSMTLFARAASDGQIFQHALDKFFTGEPDPLTLGQLSQYFPPS